MIDAGVIAADERIELVDGEFVVMAAKGPAHEWIKSGLAMALTRAAPASVTVAVESTLQLADDVVVEPDIAILPRSVFAAARGTFLQPRPEDLLVVEVAASSMPYDRGAKALLYARHGIREFWVSDANESITWIHRGPGADGWQPIVACGPEDTLTTRALPDFSARLGDL